MNSLSVVTVAFNSSKTIADTLKSVAEQDCSKLEHIIVDGLSKDSTVAISQSLIRPGGKIVSEKDKGLYDAMNKGISLASGDVVCFLNSDDFFSRPHAMSDVLKVFEDPEIKIVCCGINYVSSEDTSKVVRSWASGKSTWLGKLFGWMPPHPGFFVKRELLEKVGGYDIRFRISADYDWMMRCLNAVSPKEVHYLDLHVVQMRVGGVTSGVQLSGYIRMFRELAKAAKKNGIALCWLPVVGRIFRVLAQYLRSAFLGKKTDVVSPPLQER